MKARGIALVVIGGMVGLCCGGGAVAAVAVGVMSAKSAPSAVTNVACTAGATFIPVAAKNHGVDGYDSPEQVADATTIVSVGRQMQVPPRGWVIAVATAMQEARLYNPTTADDHDSLGVFQQRPSQGWGTAAQVTDPAYASRKFYEKLLTVAGWQSMPLTQAAQAVQGSAFPGAYAKHEAKASQLVDQVSGAPVVNVGTGPDGCAHDAETTASGWTAPVQGAHVGSGFGEDRGDHKHAGVDLMVPKHTKIVSVAAGTVIRVTCDANINCDRDGSSSTPGCGWYVDIRHAAGIISRYCHQQVHPLVAVGQQVTTGQQIGWSGTSGHSSGPHVHFEIHANNVEASRGAIDPVKFMQSKGVSLGEKRA